MKKTTVMTSLALGSLLTLGACANAQSPFEAKPMKSAHSMTKAADAKCGDAKCGADATKKQTTKKADNKCGDAKCGATIKKKTKTAEAKCGEAKCGQ
ncbi:hypothetical protein [Psychrobacter sp. FDAARGOS_221]|uniref:HvfA family oxazolone/thioamide-modified RiPP metallophore n=1 Tax=Psychrobacter sp. FDAARGOS_221 TaxID=1975705 RepID=UPI000BB537F3|nr:hypothetical protein [Psychrobacter sp. FDAARGOS_221]PNK60936.1 hypothetical protein A6J60_008620 [Psychrobacter sp. FDAARGOS_221]